MFRYSTEKALKYLKTKVARLAKPKVTERSRTIVRNLAKDGLMDDGKEDLLEGMVPFSLALTSVAVECDTYLV